MTTLFASQFSRCLADALDAAGWDATSPNAWRYARPGLGLTVRLLTGSSVSVRTEGTPGTQTVTSRMTNPVHAALHVARQLHALRVAAEARGEGAADANP